MNDLNPSRKLAARSRAGYFLALFLAGRFTGRQRTGANLHEPGMKTIKFSWKNEILVMVGLFCLQLTTIAQPVPMQLLQGHVPAAAAHLTPVGRLEEDRELNLAIGLPL